MEKLQLMLHRNEISLYPKLFNLVEGQLFNGKLQDMKFASVECIASTLLIIISQIRSVIFWYIRYIIN